MKAYKKITIITGVVAICSLILCILFHYLLGENSEVNFWVNVLLALFGSAILSLITSLVSYLYEKKQVLEGFVYDTRKILKYLAHYEIDWDRKKKVEFFFNYCDFSKDEWDVQFGRMDFFFEKIHHNRSYIHKKIYTPIINFNNLVGSHEWDFRLYNEGYSKNGKVIDEIIIEIEEVLLAKSEQIFKDKEPNGEVKDCKYSSCRPKLTVDIKNELNGRYRKIMYGKRKAEK